MAVVVFPGRGERAAPTAARGLAEVAWERGIAADFYFPDAHLGYYIGGTLPERFTADLAPLLAERYEEVWAVGVSLGALGAVLLEEGTPGRFDRIFLLGPFVGDDRAFFREWAVAGSPAPAATAEPEHLRRFWTWFATRPPDAPPGVRAAWGTRDRFAPFQEHLAAHLPPGAIFRLEGGHRWAVWLEGWHLLLDDGESRSLTSLE
ncbi:MAG: hypothetical protein JJT96_16080 [Opitutales bacterium]|nr:hypothetical protein [Opitutales bacterium]